MDDTKHVIDMTAAATVVTVLMGYLPQIAAGLTIIWTLIRIADWFYHTFVSKTKKEPGD